MAVECRNQENVNESFRERTLQEPSSRLRAFSWGKFDPVLCVPQKVYLMLLEQPLANYNGNPQIEDGHTKIANELMDALIIHDFTKRQLVILLFIMRKTYGWHKSEDDISRSQIIEATGLLSPHITTAIQELQRHNVIIISNGKHAKRYKLNKFYDTWRVTKRVIITKTVSVTKTVTITETVINDYQNGNLSLPKQYPQNTITKAITKDNSEHALACPYQELINLYHECMPDNPKCKVLNNTRKGLMKQRWKEAAKLTCKPFGYKTIDDGIKSWKEFFQICSLSNFLTGKVKPKDGGKVFFATIDFIFSPSGFAKTLENNYHRD